MGLELDGSNVHIADISRGFDSYSGMTADVTENLLALGEVGPNSNQSAFFTSMVSSAALYGVTATENKDTNFTATLLDAEEGYTKTRFWSNNFAAGSVSTGRIWLKNDVASNQCLWSSSRDGIYEPFENDELLLRARTWYTLHSADAVDPAPVQAAWADCASSEMKNTSGVCSNETKACDKECQASFWEYYKSIDYCTDTASYGSGEAKGKERRTRTRSEAEDTLSLALFNLQKCVVKEGGCGAYPTTCIPNDAKAKGGFGIPDDETTNEYVRAIMSVSTNADSVYFVQQVSASDKGLQGFTIFPDFGPPTHLAL